MIRNAKITDTEDLMEGIIAIWKDMESPFVAEIPISELKEILTASMASDDFRYRYANGIVCERNNEIAGMAFGFKGEEEEECDRFFKQLLAEKNYHTKINLSFDKETTAGEWYLDMLYTKPKYRGQGVASELLAELPSIAKETGESVLSLNCDVSNYRAKRLYEKQGFQTIAEISIVEHQYEHMIKEIK